MNTSGFTFAEDEIALPKGAFAHSHRRMLRRDGRPVLGLTQGKRRCFVYPLFTPAGFPVTAEAPADHPHHNSMWIAADHVHVRMPVAAGGHEDYTYNFYVDDTFQGRAPGTLVGGEAECAFPADGSVRITQSVEWRGPVEWAAPAGRLVARETRVLTLTAEPGLYQIDVDSRFTAAEWDVSLGPTRHAYFNMRAAESMIVANGGRVIDDQGRSGGPAISGAPARWVDFSGPVGGGHVAGIAILPDPRDHADLSWFVADWGVMTVGPFRLKGASPRAGETTRARYRVLVHDGDAAAADVAGRYAAFLAALPS